MAHWNGNDRTEGDLARDHAYSAHSVAKATQREIADLEARIEAIELHIGLRRAPEPPEPRPQVTVEEVAKLTGLDVSSVERTVAAVNLILRTGL